MVGPACRCSRILTPLRSPTLCGSFLRSQTIESGGIIARRGGPAHSMYVIAAGEVEIDLPKQRLCLGAGHFFGEIAVLRRARRPANVSAIGRINLLVLDAHDFVP